MDAVIAGLAYLAPALLFAAVCALLWLALGPSGEREDARRRNQAHPWGDRR